MYPKTVTRNFQGDPNKYQPRKPQPRRPSPRNPRRPSGPRDRGGSPPRGPTRRGGPPLKPPDFPPGLRLSPRQIRAMRRLLRLNPLLRWLDIALDILAIVPKPGTPPSQGSWDMTGWELIRACGRPPNIMALATNSCLIRDVAPQNVSPAPTSTNVKQRQFYEKVLDSPVIEGWKRIYPSSSWRWPLSAVPDDPVYNPGRAYAPSPATPALPPTQPEKPELLPKPQRQKTNPPKPGVISPVSPDLYPEPSPQPGQGDPDTRPGPLPGPWPGTAPSPGPAPHGAPGPTPISGPAPTPRPSPPAKPDPTLGPQPPHRYRPPGPRTKERKVNFMPHPGSPVMQIIRGTGDPLEILDCLHSSLPEGFQCKPGRKSGARVNIASSNDDTNRFGNPTARLECTPQSKAAAIYRYINQVDVGAFFTCLAKNEVEDRFYGAIGRRLGDAGRRMGRPVGLGTGPGL